MKNAMIPMVVDSSAHGGERTYDLYSLLLKERIIMIDGEIERHMAHIIAGQLLYLDSLNNRPINLWIQSPGGVISAGMAITDTMDFVASPVHTNVIGLAASMGSYIAAMGEPGHRYLMPNADVMIHQPLGGAQGQATDILIQAEQIQRWKNLLTKGYAERSCGKTSFDQFKDLMERDKHLTPQQAIDLGLADHIITKAQGAKKKP